MGNIVAIVGRPNVGKSTFFNRLIQKRQAIVDSVSGVTRDRHYGKTDWNGKEFSVIDTGGYIVGSDDIFEGEIRKQVDLAIEEANELLSLLNNVRHSEAEGLCKAGARAAGAKARHAELCVGVLGPSVRAGGLDGENGDALGEDAELVALVLRIEEVHARH